MARLSVFVLLLVVMASQVVAAAPTQFTFVVLPDTQNYSDEYPDIFSAQTDWIARNVQALDIRFVLHTGDLVDGRTSLPQWQVAQAAMTRLDGIVPYVLALGNHDFLFPQRDTTLFNRYFPYTKYRRWRTFGGAFQGGDMSNTYFLTQQNGIGLLILSLEFCPRSEVVQWANSVVAAHPDRLTLLLTHSYLGGNGLSTTGCASRFPNGNYTTGKGLWEQFVRKHQNMAFVLSGHVRTSAGARYKMAVGDQGNRVHQMMTNFQTWANGGNGYLKLFTINQANHTVSVKTYSPYLEQYLTGSRHDFVIADFKISDYIR